MTARREDHAPRYRRLPILILALLIVISVIGFVALRHMQAVLLARTGENLGMAAADVADRLDQILFERYGDIQMMANVFQSRDPAAMADYLNEVKHAYPLYHWIAATDAAGRIIAATGAIGVGREHGAALWFRAARDKGQIFMQKVRG